MSEHEHSTSHGNETVKFEPTDVTTRPVLFSVIGLAIFTVVFTVAAHFVYHGLAARMQAMSPPANPLAEQYAAKTPPEPRLQLRPKTDLEQMRAAEDKVLGSYAWVNKEAGVVQVPIARAMEMLVAKGLPARQGPVPAKMAPRADAPAQMPEAAGAPDWTGGWKVSHDIDESGHHGAEAGHAGDAAHAGAPAAHGEAAAPHKEAEAHGH